MKRIIIGIILVFIGSVGYLFLFGKLFMFSPVIIGFTKHELTNTIVYIQKGADFDDFRRLDTLTHNVEKFHELKFKKKPEIYIFSDSLSFIRRSLSKARFSAYPTGRLIASPWAMKEAMQKKISLEIYVRHELSHVLLAQYMSMIKDYNYPDWLKEGMAVYSANQMGTSIYPGKDETLHAIAQGNFVQPFDFKTKREDRIKLNVKYRITFMYSEFACIVDYLVSTFGKVKFMFYMKSLMKNHDNNKIFKQIYGIDFDKFMIDFREYAVKYETYKTNKTIYNPAGVF